MNKHNIYKHISGAVFTIALLISFSHGAEAQDNVKTLTEKNVKRFIEDTADVTIGKSKKLSPNAISEYLDKHIQDKAKFKTALRYHFPDLPVQEARLNMDKDDFIQSIAEGAEKIEGYENLIQIKDIKVSSNGKKAFVKTESTEYATLPVPTQTGDSEDVPIEGTSKCTQIIALEKSTIQMYSANCTTDVVFLDN